MIVWKKSEVENFLEQEALSVLKIVCKSSHIQIVNYQIDPFDGTVSSN